MAQQTTGEVGVLEAVWRYPVKSMQGEDMSEAEVTNGGILGDRAYAVVDRSNGKVASAKLPKKWGQLLELNAAFIEPPAPGEVPPPVDITWPSGVGVRSDDDDLDRHLTETLGRPVTLTTSRPRSVSLERLDPLQAEETIVDIGDLMMEGRFSDYAAFHLVTTASLTTLAELAPASRITAGRFRPNLLIGTSGGRTGFVENDWVGRTLSIGPDVRLQITDPTPRCSVPTLAQHDLPKDPTVLRSLVEHNQLAVPLLDGDLLPCIGVYAFVLQGGQVGRGDTVRVE